MKDKAIKKPKRTIKAALNLQSENGIVQYEAETALTDSLLAYKHFLKAARRILEDYKL